MAKHAITSFSYPLKEVEIIEEAERLAKEDGKSLSQLILRLLKEEINQKKVKGSPNPLNIYSRIPEEKPSHFRQEQSDIRQWLPRKQALEMARRISLDAVQWDFIGETCRIIAQRQRTGYL